jgi:1,2-diacylglycerol 3-alpha-glucosyltransferase
MNIALFTDSFLPARNGVITSILQLHHYLVRNGHKVIIVTVKSPGQNPERDLYTFHSLSIYRKLNLRLALVSTGAVVKILMQNNITIVHIHSEFTISKAGIRAAKRLNLPIVYTAHTFYKHYKHYLPFGFLIPNWYIAGMYKRYTKNFNAVICPSEKMKRLIRSVNNTVHIQVIPNTIINEKFKIDSDSNKSDNIKQLISYKNSDFIITYVGRIAREKRILPLFSQLEPLIKKYRGIKLVLAGTGHQEKRIEKYTKKYPNQVFATGYMEWEKVLSLLNMSHLFVTLSHSEVNPMTVIEAAVSAVPVIAIDDNTVDSIITSGVNGFLIQTDDQLPKLVENLVTNSSLYTKIKNNSKSIGKEYLTRDNIFPIVRLYSEIQNRRI